MSKVKKTRERSVTKGLLAGLIGGIVGTGAKVVASKIYASRGSGPASGPHEAGLQLQETLAPLVVGAAAGAIYGAAMEIEPGVGVWGGAGFGLGLRKFADLTPKTNVAEIPVRQSIRQRQSEWVAYAVFGVVTEGVRRLVRKGL